MITTFCGSISFCRMMFSFYRNMTFCASDGTRTFFSCNTFYYLMYEATSDNDFVHDGTPYINYNVTNVINVMEEKS